MQTDRIIIACVASFVLGCFLSYGICSITVDRISNSFDNALRDLRNNYSKVVEHNKKLCSFISSHWGDFNG